MWTCSIDNALAGIARSNKRRNADSHYLTADELNEAIDETLPLAIRNASHEAFEGIYDANKLAEMVDEEAIKQSAVDLIANHKISYKHGR